jgi:PAS domain S-box-containing protein
MKRGESRSPGTPKPRKQAVAGRKPAAKADASPRGADASRDEVRRLRSDLRKQRKELESKDEELRAVREELAPCRERRDHFLDSIPLGSIVLGDENRVPEASQAATDMRDITKHKRAEEALKASEERLRDIFENAPIGIYRTTPDGRVLMANSTLLRLLGFSSFERLAKRNLEKEGFEPGYPRSQFKERLERDGEIRGLEGAWRKRDGAILFIRENAKAVRDEKGEVLYYEGTVEDVTERKLAERELDRERRLLDALSQAQSHFISGRDPHDLFDNLLKAIIQLTESEYGFVGEILHDDGDAPYLKTRALTNIAWSEETREFYEKNAPRGLEFRNLNTLFGEVIGSGRIVVSNDPSADPRRGGLPEGHPPLHSFMGLPFHYGEQFVGMAGIANRPGGYDEELAEHLQPLLTTCARIIHAYRVEEQRTRAGEALKRSEERFRAVAEQSPNMIFINGGGRVVYTNRNCEDVMGYGRQEFLSPDFDFLTLIAPEYVGRVRSSFARHAAGEEVEPYECALVAKDGKRIETIISTKLIDYGDGKAILGVATDITERKRFEEALRLTQFSVDSAPDAVYWMSPDARFIYANDAACRALGYSRDELLTMSVHDIDPDFPAGVWPGHWADVKRRRSFLLETTHRRKDGRTFPVEVSVNFLEFEGREYNCAFARDITDRKRAEGERLALKAQLGQTQKMQSLNVMAGAIAHNFNNLLVVVLGNLEMILEDLPPGTIAREMAMEAEKAAKRAAELSAQMLVYVGQGRRRVETVNLSQAVREAVETQGGAIARKAVLQLNVPPEDQSPAVKGDPTQIRQVVMNLVANALEAVGEDEGTVTVAVGEMECDGACFPATFLKEDLSEGRYAWVEVSDTGCGMDEETLSKVFDPFFTRKFTGRGLGLASVLGIVRGHRGAIDVTSKPGGGAKFRVLLPAVEALGQDRLRASGSPDAGHGRERGL